ncbi:MAG: RNA polymerase factor sigma-32 [Deltaproteobacteria bacterium]|nr:RNA polymerase factor sigma-32 [Deltaproteobacteria bacterium]
MTEKNHRNTSLASTYQLYLTEIQKHPVLSAEEEKELAIKYFEGKNSQVAQKLILHNLRFVITIANKYTHYGLKMMDLIQEGNIGLMKALQTFNPYKDVRFITYAVWWIRSYIHDYIQRNWSIVKVATTEAQRKLFYKLKKEEEALQKLGLPPSPKLIAERLQLPEKDVKIMQQRLSHKDVSLDAPLTEDSTTTHLDQVSAYEETPDETLAQEQELRKIQEKLAEFEKTIKKQEKDYFIFKNRIVAEKPLTLQKIGNKYSISRERVRQIEERVKKKLQQFFLKAMPEYRSKISKK